MTKTHGQEGADRGYPPEDTTTRHNRTSPTVTYCRRRLALTLDPLNAVGTLRFLRTATIMRHPGLDRGTVLFPRRHRYLLVSTTPPNLNLLFGPKSQVHYRSTKYSFRRNINATGREYARLRPTFEEGNDHAKSGIDIFAVNPFAFVPARAANRWERDGPRF
jgi:hypothetical protein